MKRNLIFIIVLSFFILLVSSSNKNINKMIRIEEHLYSRFETYNTNYDFYYNNNNLLDSIIIEPDDHVYKIILRYFHKPDLIEVSKEYIHSGKSQFLFKESQYNFDSHGRLIKSISYSDKKIITEDTYLL